MAGYDFVGNFGTYPQTLVINKVIHSYPQTFVDIKSLTRRLTTY